MSEMWENSHTPRICNERGRTGLLGARILLPTQATLPQTNAPRPKTTILTTGLYKNRKR